MLSLQRQQQREHIIRSALEAAEAENVGRSVCGRLLLTLSLWRTGKLVPWEVDVMPSDTADSQADGGKECKVSVDWH